jgi:hypothetical protein
MASRETIIVRSPYGYFSTPNPIQHANQMTWRYTNAMEPANPVILSAIRFWTCSARSRACSASAGFGASNRL